MRRALGCVGVLLAGVLAPGATLAQTIAERVAGLGVSAQPADLSYGGPSYDSNLQCPQARALSGVVASNDRELILRFGRADFYRLRLSKACPALLEPGAHVVDITRGSGPICHARDVELKIAAGEGSVSRCTVKSLDRMSTAEVRAASSPTLR